MKKKLLIILCIVGVPFLGMSSNILAAKNANNKQNKAVAKQQQIPPTVVKIAAAKQMMWQGSVLETGSLAAFNGTMLSSEVPGRVTKIHFNSGQYVKKGGLLLEINPGVVQADLAKAQAVLKKSMLDYTRYQKLYKKGFIDKSDLEIYGVTLDGASATVKGLETQLDMHIIKAPFSGRLGLRKFSLGDYISPGVPLVSLQSMDPIRVDFNVPQQYLEQIKVGDGVTISSDALTGTYNGKVYAIDSAVDQTTRMIGIRAKIDNPKHTLVPGTFVETTVKMATPIPVIVIPATAVVYEEGANYVFLMQGNKAIKTEVTVGKLLKNNRVIINKGLKASDPVVIEGQMKLFDGSPVIVKS